MICNQNINKMQIDSFNKVTFLFNTGPIPPPFCYKYNISITSNEAKISTIAIDLEYYDRDEITDDEIYDEGFSLDDNFQWNGNLPQIWVKEIINKLNTSNWKKQKTVKSGGAGLTVKVEYQKHAENLEPADPRSWEVFIQEIIQACFELSEKEAPLYINFMEKESKKNSKQLNLTYSFAQRTIRCETDLKDEQTLSWSDGQKLLKYIYGIDYLPEKSFNEIPNKKGAFISPGDGLWYQLDASNNSADENSKGSKLEKLLLQYLD